MKEPSCAFSKALDQLQGGEQDEHAAFAQRVLAHRESRDIAAAMLGLSNKINRRLHATGREPAALPSPMLPLLF